jgi:hypothetical protein
MPKLDEQQKTFIVQELACFQTYSEVAASVKELFGVEIERQQVYVYDPTKNKVAEKWRKIFDATREKFIADTASIAIAHKSYRLRELDAIYRGQKAAKIQNTKAMKETLEQAAKEAGDAFTNKREITGKGGESLAQPIADAFGQFNKMLEKVYGADGANPDGK